MYQRFSDFSTIVTHHKKKAEISLLIFVLVNLPKNFDFAFFSQSRTLVWKTIFQNDVFSISSFLQNKFLKNKQYFYFIPIFIIRKADFY